MQKILKAVCRKKVGSLLKWPKNLYMMGTKIFKIDGEKINFEFNLEWPDLDISSDNDLQKLLQIFS